MIKGAFFAALLVVAFARPIYVESELDLVEREVPVVEARELEVNPALFQRNSDAEIVAIRAVVNDGKQYQMINKRQVISPEVATKSDEFGNIVIYDPKAQQKREEAPLVEREEVALVEREEVPLVEREEVPVVQKRQVISPEVATKSDEFGNIVIYDPSAQKRQIPEESPVKAVAGKVTFYEREVPEEVPSRGSGGVVAPYKE